MDFKRLSRSAPHIGIVGITGAVGLEMLSILNESEESHLFSEIRIFASEKNKNRSFRIGQKEYLTQTLSLGCFKGLDLVFFDASDSVSESWTKEACSSGAWVVDHSGVHRMNLDVVLGLPGVNDAEIKKWTHSKPIQKLITGPNCSTAGLVVALAPLQKIGELKSVCVSTYQSVSGAGQRALKSLIQNTEQMNLALVKEESSLPPEYPVSTELEAPVAYSLIPKIGKIDLENRYTSEENKIRQETRKILNLPTLKITATAIRVPTLRGHAGSVRVEFSDSVRLTTDTLNRIRRLYQETPGLRLMDGEEAIHLPKNQDVHGKDNVLVGRLRLDLDEPNILHLFWFSDNLRKGAALNAFQIAECLFD